MKRFLFLLAIFVALPLAAQRYDYDDIYFSPRQAKKEKKVKVVPAAPKPTDTLTVKNEAASEEASLEAYDEDQETLSYSDRINLFHRDQTDTMAARLAHIADENYTNVFILTDGQYAVNIDGDNVEIVPNFSNSNYYTWNSFYGNSYWNSPYYWAYNYGYYNPWYRGWWDPFYTPYYSWYDYWYSPYWYHSYWHHSCYGHHYWCYGHHHHHHHHYHHNHHYYDNSYYARRDSEGLRRRVERNNMYATNVSRSNSSVERNAASASSARGESTVNYGSAGSGRQPGSQSTASRNNPTRSEAVAVGTGAERNNGNSSARINRDDKALSSKKVETNSRRGTISNNEKAVQNSSVSSRRASSSSLSPLPSRPVSSSRQPVRVGGSASSSSRPSSGSSVSRPSGRGSSSSSRPSSGSSVSRPSGRGSSSSARPSSSGSVSRPSGRGSSSSIRPSSGSSSGTRSSGGYSGGGRSSGSSSSRRR